MRHRYWILLMALPLLFIICGGIALQKGSARAEETRFYLTGEYEQLRTRTEDYHVNFFVDRKTKNKYMIVQINGMHSSMSISPVYTAEGDNRKGVSEWRKQNYF